MYQKSTLGNGLRIVSEEISSVKSATIGIWVGSGSRNETSQNLGVSHFIEHLLFKGTENRSAREIAETVDAVGGQFNAFTTKEYTCYYIKVISKHLPLAMEVLSDMLFHPKFDLADIDKEREVVLEEIHMYEDAPDETIHDLYMETVWPDHPLGRSILGNITSIGQINEDNVRNYYQQNYVPTNMVLAGAGNVAHQELVEMASQYFGSYSGALAKQVLSVPQFNRDVFVRNRKIEQMHICVGTPGLPFDDEHAYTLNVLNTVLGGGLSSRLFQSIREDRGLAYSVYSYLSSYQDAGLFTLYAGTRPANAQAVLALMQSEMKNLRDHGISYAELARAKEYIKGNLLLGLENTSSRMTRLGKLELTLNKIISVEEVIDRIECISVSDVTELARRLFVADKTCITALGPSKVKFKVAL